MTGQEGDRPAVTAGDEASGDGSRRRLVFVLGVTVALLVVGGLTWWLAGDDSAGPEARPALTADEARTLEEAVNGRDPAELEAVLVLGPDDDAAEVAETALPPDSTLTIERDSFDPGPPDGFARVDATITGAVEARATILLDRRDDRWMMVGTTAPEEQ